MINSLFSCILTSKNFIFLNIFRVINQDLKDHKKKLRINGHFIVIIF